MAKPIVHDLDVLRPEPEYLKLGGKEIDISFIPSGIALDIMGLRERLEELTNTPEKMKRIETGGEEALKTFDISAELCAKITESQHKELTKEWLLKNTSIIQLKKLIDYVSEAVVKSLEAGGVETKNPQPVEQN